MESPNKNKRCPLLGLAVLLLLFITMAPVAAQEVSLNDLFAPQGVSVRLNNETGSVDWDLVTGTSRYEISYTGCRMPRVVVQAIGVHHFQIPGYDAALRYDVGVRAYGEVDGEETLLGYGTTVTIATVPPRRNQWIQLTPSTRRTQWIPLTLATRRTLLTPVTRRGNNTQ